MMKNTASRPPSTILGRLTCVFSRLCSSGGREVRDADVDVGIERDHAVMDGARFRLERRVGRGGPCAPGAAAVRAGHD